MQILQNKCCTAWNTTVHLVIRVYLELTLLSRYESFICTAYNESDSAKSKVNWGGRCVWLDVRPRIGFLILPNGEMMKTLSDKAVTNQSHCERRRTVKDISGQSSHALVRRGRPVTANSHAAPLTLRSQRKALCSCYFLFHPIPVLLLPLSLSLVFVIHSSRSVLLAEARQRDTGSADRSGQVAVCYWGFWSDGWASLACRCHKSKRPPQTHMHPPQTAPLLPTCQNVHQHWHFVTPAQFFPFLSVLLFSSTFAAHLSF